MERFARCLHHPDQLLLVGFHQGGKIGTGTRREVGTYQKSNRLKIDCWPTEAVLSHLRTTASLAPAEKPSGQ